MPASAHAAQARLGPDKAVLPACHGLPGHFHPPHPPRNCLHAPCIPALAAACAEPDTQNGTCSSGPSYTASPAPPPIEPGRKSTMLCLNPTIPPSMQRSEWCLDDYILQEKIYKGYASNGRCPSGAARGGGGGGGGGGPPPTAPPGAPGCTTPRRGSRRLKSPGTRWLVGV